MTKERLVRRTSGVNPRLGVGAAAALSAALLVVVFLATLGSQAPRGASLAAAAAFLLLVALGAYLYSWPLGAPGRSQ